MDASRVPAAARSAAVLGSRNARRQLKFVLAAALEAGAYSVGVNVARGGLAGFTVYLAGDFAGAGKGISGRAAFTCAVPRASATVNNAQALPVWGASAAAATAPDSTAARRKRGCRAGAKQQRRRHGACGRLPPAVPAATAAVSLEGGSNAALMGKTAHLAQPKPAAPPAPPPHIHRPSHPQSSPSLSPLAPTFVPPPPPPSIHPSSYNEDPLHCPPDLLHLLPHAHLSFEEQRWDYYRSHGGRPFAPPSSKKRAKPPSPSRSSPSSAIVGCVVNERRSRAAPPPLPPHPFLPRASASAACLHGLHY